MLRDAEILSQFYPWIDPELRLPLARSDVHMQSPLLAGKEEEPIRSFAEDRWAHEQTIPDVRASWPLARRLTDPSSPARTAREVLDDYIPADQPVRFIDAYVDQLNLEDLGFARATAAETGRPGYDPGDLLELYI